MRAMRSVKRYPFAFSVFVALIVALAFALRPLLAGAAGPGVRGLVIGNSTSNAGHGCDELYLRSLNADTPLFVCAQTKRPDEGGGQSQVAIFTVDGIITIVDMRPDGVEECFGARPFASRFSGTLKVMVNCRAEGTGNGNDRVPIYRDTGIPAEPVR